MNNGNGRRLNGETEEDDDDEGSEGDLDAWERTYADERSWESLQEDESGLLRPVDNKTLYHAQYRRRIRSLSSQATTSRIQKGLIRYLYIVVDLSRAAAEMDYRPSRMAVVAKHVEAFIREFFDQNPLSQLGLVTIKDGIAHCLTDLGGSPESHVKALMGKLECSGESSLQNALDLVHGYLNQIPSYGHREVLILYSALSTCDPGDILETIQKCKKSKMRCSVIGLSAEIFICKHLCQETGGSYSVAMDESHFKELILEHAPPPPAIAEFAIANLIKMGFPQRAAESSIAICSCHAWSGTAQLLPLLGASIADSFLGRYRTIVFSTLIYILGLGLLTLSAVLPSLADYVDNNKSMSCCPKLIVILFFFSLYLVAVGQGGHKPCIQAFGADQFDGEDPKERNAKSSFFNWWFLGVCGSAAVTVLALSYIQDNLSWGLGFGIPCILMIIALVIFLLGTRTYRYCIKRDETSPFVRIGGVFVAAVRNCHTTPSTIAIEEEACGASLHSSQQFKFLNKALLSPDHHKEEGKVYTISEVEEAKAVLRLFPIWATSLVYAIVYAQASTFFTKQGATLDRTLFPGFKIPAASLQFFIGLAIVLFVPLYDRIFVPIARAFTTKPSGITMLQRVGIGMLLSAACMVVAALVEIKRLNTAKELGLVDRPNVTIPMSVWWLVPQYVLSGIADVFTLVGLQEFFYDQVPSELRSVGIALYQSILGLGSLLSSLLVSVIEEATGGYGRYSWFSNNLNRAHLDYFYWLLAGLSVVAFAAYLYFAKSYIYKRPSTM